MMSENIFAWETGCCREHVDFPATIFTFLEKSVHVALTYFVFCDSPRLQIRLNIAGVQICNAHEKTRTGKCPEFTEAEIGL